MLEPQPLESLLDIVLMSPSDHRFVTTSSNPGRFMIDITCPISILSSFSPHHISLLNWNMSTTRVYMLVRVDSDQVLMPAVETDYVLLPHKPGPLDSRYQWAWADPLATAAGQVCAGVLHGTYKDPIKVLERGLEHDELVESMKRHAQTEVVRAMYEETGIVELQWASITWKGNRCARVTVKDSPRRKCVWWEIAYADVPGA